MRSAWRRRPAFEKGNRCLYDECTSDDACGAKGVCACATDEASLCDAPHANYCNCVDPAVVACFVQDSPRRPRKFPQETR